ncbi:MAG: GtrA family protein, partial [Clostridiales Family XIII bacterium]|nr:GtrA family protein [Clostridiales Family XIII bacterium]
MFKSKEFRFLLVGGLNTGIAYGLLNFFDLFFKYNIAYIIQFILGVVINYFTYKYLAFRSDNKILKELPRFVLVYVFMFLFGYAVILICIGK